MKLKYTFEVMEMDDSFVAVPVGDNAKEFSGIIKLNETAKSIFNLLNDDMSEEQIIEQLSKEYDMSSEDTKAYVHSFINQLINAGVLK